MVPATCCFEESIVLIKKRQIQLSFRTKQHLRTQSAASIVTCPCKIFTEHNTALTSHSCSGRLRGTSLDKAGHKCFSASPFPFLFRGKWLLKKGQGPERENMLPVWRQRTPYCVEATHTCIAGGIRSWRELSKRGLRDSPVTTQNSSPELPSALCNSPLQCCNIFLSGMANLLGWGGDGE